MKKPKIFILWDELENIRQEYAPNLDKGIMIDWFNEAFQKSFLTEKQKTVIKILLPQDMTWKEIGNRINVTPERPRQILYFATRRIKYYILRNILNLPVEISHSHWRFISKGELK